MNIHPEFLAKTLAELERVAQGLGKYKGVTEAQLATKDPTMVAVSIGKQQEEG